MRALIERFYSFWQASSSVFFIMRVGVIGVGLAYLIIGLVTVRYGASYFIYSPVWAFLFIMSGITSVAFGASKGVKVGVVAGAISITASYMRALALLGELGVSGLLSVLNPITPVAPLNVAFFVSMVQWVLLGTLLLVAWPVVIVTSRSPVS